MTDRVARRWPWVVFAVAMAGVLTMDAMVAWQWRSGERFTYPYWLESSAGAAAYGVVGALIASRVPGNRVGPLMLAVPVVGAVQGTAGVLAQAGASHGWSAAWIVVGGAVFAAAQNALVAVVALLLFLVPDGRPWNRLWRRCVRILLVASVLSVPASLLSGPDPGNPGKPPDADPLPGFRQGEVLWPTAHDVAFLVSHACLVIVLLMLPLAMVALLQRWRQAGPGLRQQVAWPVLGAVAGPVLIAVAIPIDYPRLYDGDPVWALALVMLPLGIAIGVFRHGLYGLDRVVSRTVSYAIVTGVVIAVYVAVVTVANTALPVTNDFAVAAATLAAAAVVRPVLRRVRGAVDRRFDRQKVDAQKAVDSFGRGLVDLVDADHARLELVAVIDELLSPSSVSLWTAHR